MGSARALSQPQPCRVRSIWPGYHPHDRHPDHDDRGHNDFGQVCSATDTERQSENGGDVRVAIKKIARPFQVTIMTTMIYVILLYVYKT